MTVDTTDILLKAAEDVQSGMWCKGDWFVDGADEQSWTYDQFFEGVITTEKAMSTLRCAEGSIALATKLLGGSLDDFIAACDAAAGQADHTDISDLCVGADTLAHINDSHLPDDPFIAGQQLAELFRQTAEAL